MKTWANSINWSSVKETTKCFNVKKLKQYVPSYGTLKGSFYFLPY